MRASRSTPRIASGDLAALRAFGEDYPAADRWLLSLSPESLLIDRIRCEPIKSWLRQLCP